MSPQREFTRLDFFELIWSEPMTKLAPRLGISDVAIKKICVRHEIPVPGLGYWAKIAAGHKFERPKLPPPSNPQLDQVRIYGAPRTELATKLRRVVKAIEAKEASTDSKIVMPETLENPHPFVVATLKQLRKQKPNEYGCLSAAGSDLFRVSVSPAQLDRAMRILNTIAYACEERGFSVQGGQKSVCLGVNGESIDFSLSERIDRKPHEQTPAEAARAAKERKRWPTSGESRPWWQPQWDYCPSGHLHLELQDHYHTGLRRAFRDGKRQRVEDLLNDFMAAIVEYAAAEKVQREESERRQKEWREREERRIEQQQQVGRNKERWTFISERIQILERADRIDRFLQYVATHNSESSQLSENVRHLIDWAKRYSELLKSACTPSELDTALADKELFRLPTVETDKWFELR